jgi:(R)-amidase
MRELTRRAVDQGAEIVSLHEMCIPGYAWLQPLSPTELADVAERVPGGRSIEELTRIGREFSTVVMAGLLEIEDGRF